MTVEMVLGWIFLEAEPLRLTTGPISPLLPFRPEDPGEPCTKKDVQVSFNH